MGLAELFASVIDELRTLSDQNAVAVSAEIPEPIVVSGERARLGAVFHAIVHRLIAASPGGEIHIRAAARDRDVEIVVESPAGGFARDKAGGVCTEPTALGVSVEEVIVSEHRGNIMLDAGPGLTSRLVVTLPTGAEAAERPRIPLPEDAPKAPPKRILVVDNDEDVASKVKGYLVRRGYRVEVAGNGKEALIMAKNIAPDMIILDVMMPDISGFDVIQVLKEDPATQHIPVMFLSILPDKDKGFRLGAVDYLVKPIIENILVESINAVFDGQKTSRAKKVLVVDDDRRVTMLISKRLAEEGFITHQAYNGYEALAWIARERPDLILLDMNMPVMNGLETLERIHANDEWSKIPVIVVTATGYADKERCINLGAAKYLTKPFIEEDLLEEVADITDQVTGGARNSAAAEGD